MKAQAKCCMARLLSAFFPQRISSRLATPQVEHRDGRSGAPSRSLPTIGGKMEEYYFAVGQHSIYAFAQVPDEVSLEAFTMAVLAGGAIASIKATPVLTAAVAVEAMQKANDVLYKPPA